MRRPFVEFEQYPGCCAIYVYNTFEVLGGLGHGSMLDEQPLTNDEWLDVLCSEYIAPIITFAHSSSENVGVFTPQKLAIWLRKQGESVQATRPVLNPTTGSRITTYFWIPSTKFNKKAALYNKKKNDAKTRGATGY